MTVQTVQTVFSLSGSNGLKKYDNEPGQNSLNGLDS
jgi:hypothetical protein